MRPAAEVAGAEDGVDAARQFEGEGAPAPRRTAGRLRACISRGTAGMPMLIVNRRPPTECCAAAAVREWARRDDRRRTTFETGVRR